MPLTPTHLGPSIFLAALFLEKLNFFALFFASFLPDFEPLFLVFYKKCFHCPHHGFFHSILGAFLLSFLLSLFLFFTKNFWQRLSFKWLKTSQNFSLFSLFFSSFLGLFFHVLFDSFSHQDVFLFWPSKAQPTLISKKVYWPLSGFFLFLLFLGVFILLLKIYDKRKSN